MISCLDKESFCVIRKEVGLRFIFIFFLFSCSAQTPEDLKDQLNSYCHAYLSVLSEKYQVQPVGSADPFQITELSKDNNPAKRILNFLGNLVSPSTAQIDSAYLCKFKIYIKGAETKASMSLILIEDESFADHTTWEKTQIIPKGEVWDNGKKFYVVVKYLNAENGESLIKILSE